MVVLSWSAYTTRKNVMVNDWFTGSFRQPGAGPRRKSFDARVGAAAATGVKEFEDE